MGRVRDAANVLLGRPTPSPSGLALASGPTAAVMIPVEAIDAHAPLAWPPYSWVRPETTVRHDHRDEAFVVVKAFVGSGTVQQGSQDFQELLDGVGDAHNYGELAAALQDLPYPGTAELPHLPRTLARVQIQDAAGALVMLPAVADGRTPMLRLRGLETATVNAGQPSEIDMTVLPAVPEGTRGPTYWEDGVGTVTVTGARSGHPRARDDDRSRFTAKAPRGVALDIEDCVEVDVSWHLWPIHVRAAVTEGGLLTVPGMDSNGVVELTMSGGFASFGCKNSAGKPFVRATLSGSPQLDLYEFPVVHLAADDKSWVRLHRSSGAHPVPYNLQGDAVVEVLERDERSNWRTVELHTSAGVFAGSDFKREGGRPVIAGGQPIVDLESQRFRRKAATRQLNRGVSNPAALPPSGNTAELPTSQHKSPDGQPVAARAAVETVHQPPGASRA